MTTGTSARWDKRLVTQTEAPARDRSARDLMGLVCAWLCLVVCLLVLVTTLIRWAWVVIT